MLQSQLWYTWLYSHSSWHQLAGDDSLPGFLASVAARASHVFPHTFSSSMCNSLLLTIAVSGLEVAMVTSKGMVASGVSKALRPRRSA